MSKITGGHTAPRDGIYPAKVPDGFLTGEIFSAGVFAYRRLPERDYAKVMTVELKAGDKFPGGDQHIYDAGELRAGEVVPKAGVYHFNLTGADVPLQEGAKFPAGDAAGDYVWAREIDA